MAINNPDVTDLPDGELDLDDEVLSLQLNLGIMAELSDRTRIGLQYLSESDLDFETKADFSGLGPALTAALGASGLLNADLDLEMTLAAIDNIRCVSPNHRGLGLARKCRVAGVVRVWKNRRQCKQFKFVFIDCRSRL